MPAKLITFNERPKIAIDTNKPLFLHQRDSHDDFIKILRKYSADFNKAVVHCFTGTQKQLDEKLCEIKYGDYIGYRDKEDSMKFWTVVDDGKIFSDNEHTVFGYKGATRTVQCATADPNEFIGI